MKQNQKNLTLFTVREGITCFLRKGSTPTNCIEEQDVSAHVMQELFECGTAGIGTSNTVDYNVLYSLFHSLEVMGFISRKSDSTSTLRFLAWHGFNSFRAKYRGVFESV